MTLSKAKLVDRLYERDLGYTKLELHRLVGNLLDTMIEQLESGESIKLSGFGNFDIHDKTARVGRNPHTEESIIISRRRVLTFKASHKLIDALNSTNAMDKEQANMDREQ